MNMYFFHAFNPNILEFLGVFAVTGAAILGAKWLGSRHGAGVIVRKATKYDRKTDVRTTKEIPYGEDKKVIVKVTSDMVDYILGFIVATIFIVSMFKNCYYGIVQAFDNTLGANDSAAWSVIFAFVGITGVGMAAGAAAARLFNFEKNAKFNRYKRYFTRKGCKVYRRQFPTLYVIACRLVALVKEVYAEKKAQRAEKIRMAKIRKDHEEVRVSAQA